MIGLSDGQQVTETLLEEIDLKIERPPMDVPIVVYKIGILVDGFKTSLPTVVSGQHPSECRLSAADVSCYGDVHLFIFTI
jgi:hypothetical protein